MKTALDILNTKSDHSHENIIEHTHNYVRLTFQTEEQYDSVKRLCLDMSFIPYDLDIIRGGYVADEGNDDGTFIRYSVVPIELMENIQQTGAVIEILSKLFMPNEESLFYTRSGEVLEPSFISELVKQAYICSGNDDWICDEPQTKTNYTPHGRIQYRDTLIPGGNRNIGMTGLVVKAKRLAKTATSHCDSSGFYTCDKTFQYKWTYETSFERYDFEIRNGTAGSYAYVSEKTTEPWNIIIDRSSPKGYFLSTIFRACYRYYYGEIDGLRRPPQNSFWKTQLHIAGIFKDDTDEAGNTNMARRFLGIGNAVKIYKQTQTLSLYDTTIHELAHTSHWNHSKKQYNLTTEEANRVCETWAVGVAWRLTSLEYPSWKGKLYFTNQHRYTYLVADLMDNTDNEMYRGKYPPLDSVNGYTIRQIEDALVGVSTTGQWKSNIYSIDEENSTRDNLTALFNAWYED